MVRKKWTKEEIVYLEENYEKVFYPDIAKTLGRTHSSITHKVFRLGLFCGNRTRKDDYIGKPLPEEWIESIRKANIGHPCSEKQKEVMSKLMKGNTHGFQKGIYQGYGFKKGHATWNKGLTKEDPRVMVYAIKDKIARAKQIFPLRDTLIEKKIQDFLSILHLEYFTHKHISEITHSYQCDIFIPVQDNVQQKTIIECDGCFWHGCSICKLNTYNDLDKIKELDKIRTKELQESGFKVIRLWEHQIKLMKIEEFKGVLNE